jgi:hypothetical protein
MTSSSVRSAKRHKVVRMNSDAKGIHQSLHCKICGQPLTPTHEGHIPNTFLFDGRAPRAAPDISRMPQQLMFTE